MFPNLTNSGPCEDLVFDLFPNPMWVYDIDSLKFLRVNTAATSCYGYSQEEFLDMDLRQIRPPEDVKKLTTAMAHIDYRQGPYKESFFKHRKKDGTIFPVQLRSRLINFQGRKAELVTVLDISDHVSCKQQHAYHKRLFQCITDISNNLIRNADWLSALDACFSILCENLKIDRVYFLQSDQQDAEIALKLYRTRNHREELGEGLSKEHLPFHLLQLLMGPIRKGRKLELKLSDISSALEKSVFKARGLKALLAIPIITGHQVRGVIGIEDCHRERTWIAEEQQVLHVLASNLSHLIKQSDALHQIRDSEQRFRALVQYGTDFISILDAEHRYTYASPTHSGQLGFGSLIGTDFLDNVHPYDKELFFRAFTKSKKQHKILVPAYRFKSGSGEWKWMETTITDQRYNANIGGFILNTKDVTEEVFQKAKKELLLSITKKNGSPLSLPSFLGHLQKKMCKNTGAKGSQVWLVSKDRSRMLLTSFYNQKSKGGCLGETKIGHHALKPNEGLAGEVWASQALMHWDKPSKWEEFTSVTLNIGKDISSAVGIPLFNGKAFLGCILLFFDLPKDELAFMKKSVVGIGNDLGGLIQQKRLEEEYREFFEISPDPFCIIGCDGKIKLVNNACVKVLGYPKEHFLGTSYEQFIHESERERVAEKFKDGIDATIDMGNEIRMITADGEERWFVWSGTLQREQKLIFAVAKDITEIKLARIAVEATLHKLQHAQRLGKLGYWYRELDSDTSEWSPETYAIYGYEPENFNPTFENVLQTFHPDDRHLMQNHPKNQLQPGKIKAFEHRIITANGAIKWVHQEIQLITDNGGTSHLEGTIQDITERKEYERKLEAINKRFLLAMLASNQEIWEWDIQKGTLRYSQVKDGIKEKIKEEPFGLSCHWFNRMHKGDRARVWKTLAESVENERDHLEGSMEYRIKESDGTLRYVLDKYRVQRHPDGKTIKVIGSVSDITESKRQLEHIQRQNKALKEIAWLQSHAVRGPLTRIMALLKHNKVRGDAKIPVEDLLQMISISTTEIDRELHKIIKITQN